MSDKRRIRFQDEELGELSIDRLYRMALRGDINHTAEFWSEQGQDWRCLAGIIFDLEPSRLDDMKSAGITRIEILGSDSNDCPSCTALQGQDFPIDAVPTLPPLDCSCVPWCRCVEIAKE